MSESLLSQHLIELRNYSKDFRLFFLIERVVRPYYGDIEIECYVKWHFKVYPNRAHSDCLKHSERMTLSLKPFGQDMKAAFGKYIVVDEKFRGLGVGSYILSKLIQAATSLTNKAIEVEPIAVYTGDPKSRDPFYERNDFKRKAAAESDRAEWYAVVDDLRDLNSNYNAAKIREVEIGEFLSVLCQRQGDFVKSYNKLAEEAEKNAFALQEFCRLSLWGKWRNADDYRWVGDYREKPLIDLSLVPPFSDD